MLKSTLPEGKTANAVQARIRIGADRRINELLAVAPHLTDDQLARIASLFQGGQR